MRECVQLSLKYEAKRIETKEEKIEEKREEEKTEEKMEEKAVVEKQTRPDEAIKTNKDQEMKIAAEVSALIKEEAKPAVEPMKKIEEADKAKENGGANIIQDSVDTH